MHDAIEDLRSFQSRLLLAIHGIAEEDRRRAEGEGRWSIADVIGHLADTELIYAARLRAIVAEERPKLMAFSQNDWVAAHASRSTDESLDQLWSVRRLNLRLLERLPEAAWDRVGEHATFGPLTLRDAVAKIREHQERHLGQIARIKVTLQLSTTNAASLAGVTFGRDGESRLTGDGIRITDLWGDGFRRALRVDFDRGAQWPGLDHHVPGPEEVYVLSGAFSDGVHRFEAGTFIHHPAGTSHSPVAEDGCSLLVFYPEG